MKVALFLDALSVGIMHRPSKDISPNESHPVARRQYTYQIKRTVTVVPLLHYVYYSQILALIGYAVQKQ
jgi:hypothetical protein